MDKNLMKLLKEFLYHLEFDIKKKENTIISIKNDLLHFIEFFNENLNLEDQPHLLFNNYVKDLESLGFKTVTINRKISSLKSFFKFLYKNGYIENNLYLYFKRKNYDIYNPDFFTFEEIDNIRNSIQGNNFKFFRDKLIFELMYSSGITPHDLLSLSEYNFDINNRKILILKNKNKIELYFSNRTVEAFEEYFKIRNQKFYGEYNKNYIFTNNSNEKLTDRSLRRIFDKYFKKAGINREVSLYTFRHTFCIHMLSKGFEKEYLKELLSIKNNNILNIYEKISKEVDRCQKN